MPLDATLIEIDRVNERTDIGHHLWYSGKHKTQGDNVQIVADPGGFPVWSSEVEPAVSTTSPPPAPTAWARCTRPPPTVCQP